MFEDSLIESGGKLKTKRGLTSSIAFIFEAVLVGVLVLIPLLVTDALPKAQLMMSLVAPPPPPPPPPPPTVVHVVKQVQTNLINDELRTPTKIPKKIEMIKEDAAPPPQMAGVVGGIGGPGQVGGVIGGIISSTPVAVPHVATPTRIRVSQGVTQGLKIRDVHPVYPPLARQARIQGTVLLQAVISKDGSIQNLRVISGHPMLVPAAIDAVQQWKYKPYILNGEPVEVETQITVNFTLGG
ncbi:MAG: energy transducer TonB [Terriglobales bacterium]